MSIASLCVNVAFVAIGWLTLRLTLARLQTVLDSAAKVRRSFPRSHRGRVVNWVGSESPAEKEFPVIKSWKKLEDLKVLKVCIEQKIASSIAIDVKSKEEINPWIASWENRTNTRRTREKYVNPSPVSPTSQTTASVFPVTVADLCSSSFRCLPVHFVTQNREEKIVQNCVFNLELKKAAAASERAKE